ncbi:hypothetical protein AOQ84DRAFT_413832 [Glonium stellatum]|uniref:FAD-binding domain-containing protein n=1 Tax=Glonium stellatum TaxID=574774 RepID=A0A8E2EUU2_9PEZI|nr:hypothetical protein AOQ84DRAFT_413832 [Glonium stellatum]
MILTSRWPRSSRYAKACVVFDSSVELVEEKIRVEGFVIKGLAWRKRPVDDGQGGKKLGDIIAAQPFAELDDDAMPPGTGILCLQQSLLTKLILREALATGLVKVLFNHELIAISESKDTVTAVAKDTENGLTHNITADFLIGAAGGRSTTRELLGIPFPGHTWPERLLATNVKIQNIEDPIWHCHYVLDQINYTVITPLIDPVVGQSSLWRYTMALNPEETRSGDELLSKACTRSL